MLTDFQETSNYGDEFFVAAEFKFVDQSEPGLFSGYASAHHVVDSHGDMVVPGAFAKSLAAHKAAGTMPGMYVEHSQLIAGGDPLPVGKWLSIEEDGTGLRVKGRLSALDTEHGRRLRGLMMDGALPGMSIAYTVPPGGASYGKKQGEPRRTLREIHLDSIDIVRKPSNPRARIDSVKFATGIRFENKRHFEDHLRSTGISGGAARLIANAAWPALEAKSEPDEERAAAEFLKAIDKATALITKKGSPYA